MTGKTLTINDLMKVPVTQPAPKTIVVPAIPEEEEGDIFDWIDKLDVFLARIDSIAGKVERIIENLAKYGQLFGMPPEILQKIQQFKNVLPNQLPNLPIINKPSNVSGQIDNKQIIELLENLPIPDDVQWKEVKNFAKKILGGGNADLGSMDKKPSERSSEQG